MNIDVDGEMGKDMEEIVKKERLIGQQILLVRMIHVENERGFSFISIGHRIQKANKTYREKYDLENNCETVSNEILKEALDYFGKYYISTIIKVKQCGFEWDVIVEMLKNELSKEELLYLRKQIIQRTT